MNEASSLLALKTFAPRRRKTLAPRPRLDALLDRLLDHQRIIVVAPPGYGKTHLLAQWRRRLLITHRLVAWMTLGGTDDESRVIELLVISVRQASGRPQFGTAALQALRDRGAAVAYGLAISELTTIGKDIVLLMDDVDRITDAPARALAVGLITELPPNCVCIVSGRNPPKLPMAELLAYGGLVRVDADDLRFRHDEVLDLIRRRLGPKANDDVAARLLQRTEGWPMGLELAIATIAHEPNPASASAGFSGKTIDVSQHFNECVLSHLAPPERELLRDIAILDPICADLARAVTRREDAGMILEKLAIETPFFLALEGSEWLRLHQLARDFLLNQQDDQTPHHLRQLHQRAARWLATAGRFEEATDHALRAGAVSLAKGMIQQALLNTVREGHIDRALFWVSNLKNTPAGASLEVQHSIAWTLAISVELDAAECLRSELLPRSTKAVHRDGLALIGALSAAHRDLPDAAAAFLSEIPDPNALLADFSSTYSNLSVWLAQVQGDADPMRGRRFSRGDVNSCAAYHSYCVNVLLDGLGRLAAARPRETLDLLGPICDQSEIRLGRRAPPANLLAAGAAAAAWELGRLDAARARLADRLELFDARGQPETLWLAYMTAARLADAEGDTARCLDLLTRLSAVAEARGLVRITVQSQAEQIRYHVQARRSAACDDTAEDLRRILRDLPSGGLNAPRIRLAGAIGLARAALAHREWDGARAYLTEAYSLARRLRRERDRLEILLLQASLNASCGREYEGLVWEVYGISRACGLVQIFAESAPGVLDLLMLITKRRHDFVADKEFLDQLKPPKPRPGEGETGTRARTGMLTYKESQVLRVLAAGMTNKEIARALDIGDETVKSHMKNLMSKLDAHNRRTLIERARLLDLVEVE